MSGVEIQLELDTGDGDYTGIWSGVFPHTPAVGDVLELREASHAGLYRVTSVTWTLLGATTRAVAAPVSTTVVVQPADNKGREDAHLQERLRAMNAMRVFTETDGYEWDDDAIEVAQRALQTLGYQ